MIESLGPDRDKGYVLEKCLFLLEDHAEENEAKTMLIIGTTKTAWLFKLRSLNH